MRKWREALARTSTRRRSPPSSATWLGEPRTNTEIRDYVASATTACPTTRTRRCWFARTLLPLVQLPPAGFYDDTPRARRVRARTRGPCPTRSTPPRCVLRRYLAAFGPAQRRDVAAWCGVAQARLRRCLGARRHRLLPRRAGQRAARPARPAAPAGVDPASAALPRRTGTSRCSRYADRERIIPPEVAPLKLTLSGSPTVTVDGRVAASWDASARGRRGAAGDQPHVEIRRAARAEIRAEAERTARICEPDARRYEVAGL